MPLQIANSIAQTTSSQTILYQHGQKNQPVGISRELPIDLDLVARSAICEQINQILADSIILYSLYKKHHWLMQGNTVYQLHLLLDKHADEQLRLIDLMSERVQILGGVAITDPRHVAEVTRIERPPNGVEEVLVMLSRLLAAHELILREIWEGITKTMAHQDGGTNDLLMSDMLRTHEFQVWFLAEHLVDTLLVRN